MMSSSPLVHPIPLKAQNLRVRVGVEASIVLAMFHFRWLGGILENFGATMLSQIAAVSMLGGLAILFLLRMRLAADSTLFVTGALAWFFSGSISFVANPGIDLRTTASLLLLLLLYALFANAMTTYLRNIRGLQQIYRTMTGFIVLGTLLAIYQVFSGTGFVEAGREYQQRAFGSDVHPVSFAIQILAAMVALEICRVKQARPPNWVHLLVLVLGCLALYLTLARTAWMMGLVVVAIIVSFRGSAARRALSGALILGLGLILAFLSGRFEDLASLPMFLANFSASDMVFDWRYIDNSVSWRIVNWSIGFNQALQHPLLGFGPGQSANSSFFNLEMHNIFLEVFVEGGIIGVMTFCVALAGLFRMHLRLPRVTPRDKYARLLANGFGISLLLAVTLSTSFVDQLMSFLIYLMVLTAAATQDSS